MMPNEDRRDPQEGSLEKKKNRYFNGESVETVFIKGETRNFIISTSLLSNQWKNNILSGALKKRLSPKGKETTWKLLRPYLKRQCCPLFFCSRQQQNCTQKDKEKRGNVAEKK